jgi:hypothetical protein
MTYKSVLNNVSSQLRGASQKAMKSMPTYHNPAPPEPPVRENPTSNILNNIGLEIQREGGN